MMSKILIYAYCVGVFSSRRMEKRLLEDLAFRVLAAGNQPDFRTISDFRKLHLQALQGLFDQVLQISLEAGKMKLGRVALDGSKVKANASKHKAMSYGRMPEVQKRLREEVKILLQAAEAADAEEDSRYGRESGDEEVVAELTRRESRLARIREAKKALEERARTEAEKKDKPPETAKPEEKDQYNFTDPESRIMKGADGFVQAYNAQIAVEEDFQLIVGQEVTQAANDKEQLPAMVETIEQQSGQIPAQILADSGYGSEKVLQSLETAPCGHPAIDLYIATILPPSGRSTASPIRRASEDRYPKVPPAWTGCGASCRPRWERPCMRHVRQSWNRSLARSNTGVGFASFCYEG